MGDGPREAASAEKPERRRVCLKMTVCRLVLKKGAYQSPTAVQQITERAVCNTHNVSCHSCRLEGQAPVAGFLSRVSRAKLGRRLGCVLI